jgi:excisionase family DNA binding protein
LGWRLDADSALGEGIRAVQVTPTGSACSIQAVVVEAIQQSLAPYLRRLADPEPLVYSVREAAYVLSTSTNTVRRLVDEGVLPIVPHMGQRVIIPRKAVVRLVEAGAALPDEDGADSVPTRLATGA